MRDIVIYNASTPEEKIVLRTDLIDAGGNFTVMWTDGITEANSGLYFFKQGTVTSLGDISIFIAENNLTAIIDSPERKGPIEAAIPYLNWLTIDFVVDRETYYSLLPKHYTDRYRWEDDPNIPSSLPWIVMYWNKVVSNSEMTLTMKKDGTDIEFAEITDRLTTVSEDGKIITTALPMDVFWDIDTQLQVSSPEGEYEVTATLGGITKIFKATL